MIEANPVLQEMIMCQEQYLTHFEITKKSCIKYCYANELTY